MYHPPRFGGTGCLLVGSLRTPLLQIPHRLAVVTYEDIVVMECAGSCEAHAQAKLPLQNL